MNWKLILGVVGTVFAVLLVLYTAFGSCEDAATTARMNRKSADTPPTAGPPVATNPPAPANPAPANPHPAGALALPTAHPAVAPIPAGPGPTAAAPASNSAQPVSAASLGVLAAPPRQRGSVNPNEMERIRHSLVRLNRIQVAIDDYCRANQGRYPSAIYSADGRSPLLSWRVAILPYLGYADLHQRIRLNEAWNSPYNLTLLSEIPVFYQSPERGDERTNYLGGSVLAHPRGMNRGDVADGLEHTLLLVEADDAAAVPWTEPRDLPPGENYRAVLGRLRPNGFLAVWCSGLVSSIPARVTPGQLTGAFSPGSEDSDSYLALSEAAGPKMTAGLAVAPVPGASPTLGPVPSPAPVIEDPENPATIRPTQVNARPTNPVGPDASAQAGLQSVAAMAALARSGIQRGQEPQAFPLAYASAALDSDPKGMPAKFQWVPALRRPALAVRFGIGVEMPPQFSSAATITAAGKERIVPKTMNGALAQNTGELGDRLVDCLENATIDGHFGSLLRECATTPTPPPTNLQFAAAEKIHSNEYFFPGIAYVGRGPAKQLLAWAQQDALDVLIIYRVESKVAARGQFNYSETSISIHDVAKGTELYSTPTPINSRKVQVDRQAEKEGRDPVAVFMEKPLQFIEQNFRLTDFPPALTSQPALVKSRVDMLLAGDPPDPLATLAEIRAYQSRGLLDAASFKAACRKLLDDDAADKLVADVPFESRLQAVQRWMPKLRVGPPVPAVAPGAAEFDP